MPKVRKNLSRVFSLTRFLWIITFTYIWLLLVGFSIGQLIIGLSIAIAVSALYRKQEGYRKHWYLYTAYACLLTIANIIVEHIKVSFKTVTGRINPCIYRLRTKIKSDVGLSMLVMLTTFDPNSFVVEAKPNDILIYFLDKGEIGPIKKINKLLERSFE